MSDRGRREFQQRVARLGRAHARGEGFETDGTLGRSHYGAAGRRWRMPVMGPVLVLMAGALVIKAGLHAGLGAAAWNQRMAALAAGVPAERVVAVLMQPDPATLWISARIRSLLR